jgi:hypothetical protein
MSFCVASYFICSPRASSASATSASSPIESTLLSCRCASVLSTPLHRKTNRKLRPLLPRTRCGVVPSAAGPWWSSSDSRRHNSNSVLHRSGPRLHEITRPHTALSTRFRASRRSLSPLPWTTSSCPRLGALRPSTRLCTGAPAATPAALTTPPNFNPAASLHSICIGPASVPRQRLPSNGFFERDTSHFLSALSTHPGVASEKASMIPFTKAAANFGPTSPRDALRLLAGTTAAC